MSHLQNLECHLLRKDPVSVSVIVVTLVLVVEESTVPVLGSASARYTVRNRLNVKEQKEGSDTGQDWCCRFATGLDLGAVVDSIARSVECFLCLNTRCKMAAADVPELVAAVGSMTGCQFATDPAIVVAAAGYLVVAEAATVVPGWERLAGSIVV